MKLMTRLVSTFLTSVFLVGCVGIDVISYLNDHPEFSPIVPRGGKTEYQVVLSRSWRPMIYLKAFSVEDELGDYQKYFVSYAITEKRVPKLRRVEIPLEHWQSIEAAVDQSPIWNYDSMCDERSYKERRRFYRKGGDCSEFMMLDGGEIMVAISEPDRQIGITSTCQDLDTCKPFGDIAAAILNAIGKEDMIQ